VDKAGGHEVGSLAGGGDGGVGGPEVVGDAGGAQPTGDGTSAGGEDRPEEETDETRGRARVEQVGQMGKPLARGGGGRA